LKYTVVLQPFSKSKLELKSNLSKIFPVNCNFISDSTPILFGKTRTWNLTLSAKKKDKNTDEKIFASLEFDVFRV